MKEIELAGTPELERGPQRKPKERDHRVEEARMVKKHPLGTTGSQAWTDSPGLLGLCFSVRT